MSFFTKISQNPWVHVIIAAFIGAVIPILLPAIQSGNVGFPLVRVAIAAGIGAVLRVVVLAFPTAKPSP